MLDFWTAGCINCMHVVPELKRLEHKYPNELMVIGVHSAKFTSEKDTENLRESILHPSKKIVVGFQPLMPTFAGQLSEEQVLDLVAYIKSLIAPMKTEDPPPVGRRLNELNGGAQP